jgi:orotidine-5'-phosphate decarboxylase
MTELIIALDNSSREKTRRIIDQTIDLVSWYKIGPVPFILFGMEIIEELKKRNKNIFFDPKLFDIPNTVKTTVKAAGQLEINMLTIHLSGGKEMIKAAVEGKNASRNKPKIIGVTVLTSVNKNSKTLRSDVINLAEKGERWGIDGIVCSGQELPFLRKKLRSPFMTVCPGIRMTKESDDQKRIVTPAYAAANGADFIVVGRPICQSENPAGIVEIIKKEIENNAKSMD